MAFGVGPAPHPSQRETARAGEARAAEVNMTYGVTNEVIAGRLQVVLGDVDLFRIPRVPDPSRRKFRRVQPALDTDLTCR